MGMFDVYSSLFQVGICSAISVVYINGTVAYTSGPLPLIVGIRLEFIVSTKDSGLEYDSKYQMTIEGRHGSERGNASRTFPLSKLFVHSSLIFRLLTSCSICMSFGVCMKHEAKSLFV